MCTGVYLFFPETNGLALEEVDQIFLESKTMFDPVTLARTMPKGKTPPQQDDMLEVNQSC